MLTVSMNFADMLAAGLDRNGILLRDVERDRDLSPIETIAHERAASDNFMFADDPTSNGPIWYERSTNMRRHEDWMLGGVTAVFRQ